MFDKKKERKLELLEQCYSEYLELRKAGLSHESALAQFDYLHQYTLTLLKKLISERIIISVS